MSLHLVDQRVIKFHMFCVIIPLHQKNAPKYIFLHISKWKFQQVRHTFWVLFQRVFNVFCWHLERTWLNIITLKNGVEEFLFFASFKSYDHFSEENACFINSQSLTACQNQTRQVIKISQHHFLEKGVKKT